MPICMWAQTDKNRYRPHLHTIHTHEWATKRTQFWVRGERESENERGREREREPSIVPLTAYIVGQTIYCLLLRMCQRKSVNWFHIWQHEVAACIPIQLQNIKMSLAHQLNSIIIVHLSNVSVIVTYWTMARVSECVFECWRFNPMSIFSL